MWLIVGASGFIGANFVNYLFKKDHAIKLYDIKKSKYLPKNLEIILGDIRNKKKLSEAMEDCEVVFHLATISPSSRLPKKEIYDIEVNGTKTLLDIASKKNVRRFVFTSSASHVYGLTKAPMHEDSILYPINEYGRNKIISEQLCKNNCAEKGLETVILRLSMVLGRYNLDQMLLENLIPFFKNKTVIVPGSGECKSQALHVEDVNKALIYATEPSLKKFEIFNISSERTLSVNEWMNIIKHLSSSKSQIKHLPIFLVKKLHKIAWYLKKTNVHPSYLELLNHDQIFDISKAKKKLSWKPMYPLENAMMDTINFLKKEIKT